MKDWTDTDIHMQGLRKILDNMSVSVIDADELVAICEAFKQDLEDKIISRKGL